MRTGVVRSLPVKYSFSTQARALSPEEGARGKDEPHVARSHKNQDDIRTTPRSTSLWGDCPPPQLQLIRPEWTPESSWASHTLRVRSLEETPEQCKSWLGRDAPLQPREVMKQAAEDDDVEFQWEVTTETQVLERQTVTWLLVVF